MTIVVKDIVLDLARHMVVSQSAMCHNVLKTTYIFLFSQISPRARLLT
jgi:hypothetical protein